MKLKIISFLLIFFSFIFVNRIFAVNYPNYVGYVNDFGDIYSSEFESKLNYKLSEFEKNTGGEIAVVSIKSMEGETVEEYAVKLFEIWKIGKSKEDNGLLLLISKDDREVRIEVGYGYEPYITDARAGEIIRNDIVPEFKKSNYEEGTERAIDSIISLIANKDIAPIATSRKNTNVPIWLIFFGIYIFGTYLASFLGRSKEIWPGGVLGAILGLIFSLALGVGAAILIAFFAGLLGLFLDIILSKNYKIRKDKGLPTGFWHSTGGFSSGGGGSSFGGFGGGSSGGGGASGRW